VSRWLCSLIGAREHYAIPRALQRAGVLDTFFTDFWAGPAVRRLRIGKLRALAARYHPDLAKARVLSWNLRALVWDAHLRRCARRGGESDRYRGFVEVGRRFSRQVRGALVRHDLRGAIFYGYDTGSLETMAWLRERGVPCILNQVDPARVEDALVREEEELWPGWSTGPTSVPEEHFARREQEWALADRVVVNSEFSRAALVAQGVPAAKLRVIPLCYEPGAALAQDETPAKSRAPLTVLFLGQVILRKGIPYLLEAARMLPQVRFEVVGPIGISAVAVARAPSNLRFHGRATRDQLTAWYSRSDVFVLPTISDGFAVTQIEALAHGLPVIATTSCGDVVSDGRDGFVVPPRRPDLIAQAILRYLDEPELLCQHRAAALRKAEQFGFARLTASLLALGEELKK
jgi:glycosyltransferase involved in cell wall biosynthesis